MAIFMKALGAVLILFGLYGTYTCANLAKNDDEYFRAVKGVEKYPGNMLYQTELRMAEPRHMLYLAGQYSSAPLGIIFGSQCFALGALLASARRPS